MKCYLCRFGVYFGLLTMEIKDFGKCWDLERQILEIISG